MAKRLVALLGMLALMLAAAVPALAQQAPQYGGAQYAGDEVVEGIPATDAIEGIVTEISGSAVLVEENLLANSGGKGYFTVTDETEITKQENGQTVPAAFEDLAVGQAVEAAYAGAVAESYPTQGNAASIAILEEAGPPPGRSATLSFELAVECEPPEGATFFGNVRTGEGGPGIFAQLLDPDGDGLYAGVATLPDRFAPGPAPEGAPPVSLPVQIVQGTGTRSVPAGTLPGEPTTVVRDFGAVPMEAENTFSASVSFCDDGNGGGVNGGGGPDDTATPGGPTQLPATGGLTVAGAIGAALLAGGLVARRFAR